MNKDFTLKKWSPTLKIWVSAAFFMILSYWTTQVNAQPSGKYGPESKNYSVPGGAYFVSPNGTGKAPCSEGNPCSLPLALQNAPEGSTIVMKGGTYRTSKYSTTTIRRRLTIQPYPGVTVILKGSEVKRDWVASGSTWKGSWSSLVGKPDNDDGRAVGIENPMADHRDMVYINGQSQWQVSNKSEVGPGKFYVDYSSKTIYIGSDPSGKQVEISAQWWGLNSYGVSASGITIRGLKFMHYTDAGIFIGSPGAIVENNEIVWNAAAGIRVQNASDVVLKNNLFAYNACQGGGIAYADRIIITENSFIKNNNEKFNRNSWSASGIKILWTKDAEVRNNRFEDNDANGIWLDARANNAKIVNNFVKNNSRNGIHCEISNDAIIAGNVVLESGKDEMLQGTGISVANSSGVKVYNNTLYNNEVALDVVEFSRNQGDPNDPYITRNTIVKNNILSEAFFDGYPSALYHMKKKECDDKVIAEQDNNAYYRSKAGDPDLAVRWKVNSSNCGDEERLETIQEFRNKLGYEKNGFGIQGGSDPFFVDAGLDNFRLKSTSLAIKSGAPLPSDVAQAMGWEGGKAVDIGAYQSNISQSPTAKTGNLPWKETFTTSDRSTDDNGLSDGSAWKLNRGSMSDNAAFNVMSERLQARGTVGEGSWHSEKINITGQKANISLMLYSQGALEDKYNPDYVKVYYRVDGLDFLLKEAIGNIGSTGIKVSASDIRGTSLELIVKFKNSDYTEFYFLDNIEVTSSGSTEPKADITSISLVEKANQSPLENYDLLSNNVELDKSNMSLEEMDIHVEAEGDVGSVVFDYNGQQNYHIDNEAPYTLHGNESATSQMGINTVTVKVYSEADGKGVLLNKKTFSFTVKETVSHEAIVRWFEDFSLPQGTTNDLGSTAWHFDASTVERSRELFRVEDNKLRFSETSPKDKDGYVTWLSESINISGQPSAKVSLDVKHMGNLESDLSTGDFITVLYRVDDQPLQTMIEKRGGFTQENQWYTFEQSNIVGKKLQILIRARTTTNTESYYVDNISVMEENVKRPMQMLPWSEDFSGADDLLEQQDKTAWFFAQSNRGEKVFFGVKNQSLYFSNHASTVKWSSYPIQIAGAEGVKVSFDIKETGGLENSGHYGDYLNVYYRLDGGDLRPILLQNGNLTKENNWAHIEQGGIKGQTIEIIVEGKTSSGDEIYYIDNVQVIEEGTEEIEEEQQEATGSLVTIYAAGKSGYEKMELRIDGQTVMAWDGIGGNVYDPIYEEYVYEHKGEKLKASQVQVMYVNEDGYRPFTGIRVDKIEIDGEVFETEASTTYGVGVYAEEACQEGYMESESLECDGYFRYMATDINNYFLEINAYPNPARDVQTLEFVTNVDQVNVRIIDMQGMEMISQPQVNTSNTLQLDLSSLRAGIYVLHVSSGSTSTEMRIYKE